MSRQFELSFSRIKGLVVVTGQSLDVMKKKVLSLAGETTRAPIELADALYYITSAGIKDTVTALDVLEVSAKAAAAGLGTTNTVADAVTSTMNAYGVANMSAARATDILVATVREGKAEADTFAPALGKVLPVAAAYGASFEDVSAAIAALSRGGLSAGTAAIYVRQTLSQLLKPSKAAQEVLTRVGLSAESIRTKVQDEGLFPALEMLRDKLNMNESLGDMTKVFGNVRALTAVLSLVGPAADANRGIFERLNNSTGDLDYAFKAYSGTLDADFQRSTAASQTALIELGNALKPIISGLLQLQTKATKAFAAIFKSPIGKGFTKIFAGIVMVISVFGILLKTMSAFTRLGSNLNIMLFGQQLQYNATTGAVTRYQITTAATTATVATATTAATAATPAVYGWATANGFLATSLMRVGVAMRFLTSSMVAVSAALAIFMLVYPLLKNWGQAIFGERPIKDAEDYAGQVGKVNELLNETAKYGRTATVHEVIIDVKVAKRNATNDVIKEELNESAPELIGQITDINNKYGGAIVAAYVQAMINTNFAGNSDELKESYLNFFVDSMNIKPEDLKKSGIAKRTGDTVTDAAFQAAAIAASSIAGRGTLPGMNFDPLGDVNVEDTKMADYFTKVYTKGEEAKKAKDSMTQFGSAFIKGIRDTGEVDPVINGIGRLSDANKKAGLSMRAQGTMISKILGPALQGLAGEYELVGDKGGNLATVFQDDKNKTALMSLIGQTFDLEDAVAKSDMYEKLKGKMANLGGSAEDTAKAFEIFRAEVNAATKAAPPLATAIFNVENSLGPLEERFKQGLSPAIQGLANDFETATNAIKEFERGQEALMGLTKTGEETQMAFRESLRNLAKDASKSGGDLFSGTENADATKAALMDSMQSVLDVANVFAANNDAEGAARVIGEGQARIMATGMANGMKETDIAAFFETMNFNEEILDTFKGSTETTKEEGEKVGAALTAGMQQGVENGKPALFAAIGSLSDEVIARLKKSLIISSPSKRVAKEVGEPTATGFAMGFKKEMAGNSGKSIEKSLNSAIQDAYKNGGRKGANKFYESFLEKKSKVETPAEDFVKATIGRMKDIIGSLSSYISSQLNFRKAQSELAKLINMQRGLEDRKKKAAREGQYAATRFGGKGGAEVTGYEQSKIDDLQIGFEKASRSYAMGRTTYADLVDAEIALFEARAAASAVNDDVLGAENAFVDAAVEVENKLLNLADATVNVLKAYQEQQEAAAILYINHKELNKVYTDLATASGIASGKLQVGSIDLLNLGGEVGKYGGFVSTVGDFTSTLGGKVISTKASFDKDFFGGEGVFANIVKAGGDVNTLTKSIGADFINLSAGLLNTDSEMYKNLASLGPSIFNAIQTAAQDALDKSPLNLKVSVNATVTTTGGGGGGVTSTVTSPLGGGLNTPTTTNGLKTVVGGDLSASRAALMRTIAAKGFKKAVGGPVVGMKPYMVGERGPEMFVPKVSGTIVTNSALERYTRVKEPNSTAVSSSANNISVTVNNPVPEAAQDSITRRMKVLANSGMFG